MKFKDKSLDELLDIDYEVLSDRQLELYNTEMRRRTLCLYALTADGLEALVPDAHTLSVKTVVEGN